MVDVNVMEYYVVREEITTHISRIVSTCETIQTLLYNSNKDIMYVINSNQLILDNLPFSTIIFMLNNGHRF